MNTLIPQGFRAAIRSAPWLRPALRGGRPLTGTRIDGVELLFSSTGRIGRVLFLGSATLLLALTLAYQTWLEPIIPSWSRLLVYPVLLFSGACVLSKRLHDRGRAGWWAAIVLLALMVGLLEPYDLRQILSAIVMLIALVDLGLWPGQTGFNRFGPSPVDPTPAPPPR